MSVKDRLEEIDTLLRNGHIDRARFLIREALSEQRREASKSSVDAAEVGVLREELTACRKKSAVIELNLKSTTDNFRQVLTTFEKFRNGIGTIHRLRSIVELPKLAEQMKRLFALPCLNLILASEVFSDFLTTDFSTPPQAMLRDIITAISPGRQCDSAGVYLGPTKDLPYAELLFTPRYSSSPGSCFVGGLFDPFDRSAPLGLLVFYDLRVDRYTKDKATDFLEHFCDVLSGVLMGIVDRHRAEALREDVERMTRHDLKTPLSAILSLPQFLEKDGNLTAMQKEMLGIVREAGYRMLHIIDLSMSLYKMERKTYQVNAQPVDVLALARRIGEDLAAIFEDKECELVIRLDGEEAAPEDVALIRGEELLCYTMLANLIKNALEATPEGEPVAFSVSPGKKPTELTLTVHNKGEVPYEVRSHFFEKYATAGKTGGTGLGTYCAKLVADTLGGGISMKTSQKEGTTITVRLPAWVDDCI